MNSKKPGFLSQKPRNQSNKPLLNKQSSNIRFAKIFPEETITDKENIFMSQELLTAIIEDITTIKTEHRSTQKSIVSLIPIMRQIVREELTRFRGYS